MLPIFFKYEAVRRNSNGGLFSYVHDTRVRGRRCTGLLEDWINKGLNYRVKTEIIHTDEVVVDLRSEEVAADSRQICFDLLKCFFST